MTSTASSKPVSSMYATLLAQAAAGSAAMLSQALTIARQSIRDDAQRMRSLLERDHLEVSVKLLEKHAPHMAARFPPVLTEVFRHHVGVQAKLGMLSGQNLRLEQLELMDETQVQERVELARVLQHVMLKVDAQLTELNTFVCALLGIDHVSPERNPLRPDSYVSALQQLMTEMKVPTLARTAWLQHLAQPLGEALSAAYLQWSAELKRQHVVPVGFSVVRTPSAQVAVAQGEPRRAPRAVWTPEHRQTVLTLDRLRRLMTGSLDTSPVSPKEAFARQFSQEFESSSIDSAADSLRAPDTGFEATVPAAFEALQEMQQVDVVVQRMQQRRAATQGMQALMAGGVGRNEMTQHATTMSHVLSLEVVSLMVENLVNDTRLLAPVRKIIELMEPALLKLVLIDPRFFIDREHPARRLLQEISQRGLAFGSTEDAEFNAFLLSLQRHVSPLTVMEIESVEPFELALQGLLSQWREVDTQMSVASLFDSAVAVLDYAEKRNLLAEKMASWLLNIPDMQRVPRDVSEFLRGPWTQVMADAELKDKTRSDDPGQYKILVNELLWSAQPGLTRKDVSRLTKMVPRLLSRLREGLGLICYPSVKTSAFFDVLMKLHQQAFRPAAKEPVPEVQEGLAASLQGSQDHWVAPAEAKVSGFLAFSDDLPQCSAAPVAAPQPEVVQQALVPEPLAAEVVARSLSVGAWVELQNKGVWQRTQLSWISPHHTMYLFTSVKGKTQSMTQRLLERMLEEGRMRVVSDQSSMLDGALDAVVHTAMLNSLDVNI
ncbi:MAG: DUF1631 family protein [Comamonadaceae bacterium]|nr:DUF1631 family protein [Comamonadaceae bacterium]